MSITVLESISVELLRRLNLLVNNDGAYQTDVCEAIRPTRFGTWTPQDLQILLTKGSEEVIDELSFPGNPPSIARRQTFNIRCHVMADEQDTTAIETIINTFAADVVLAVCSETEWYQFDGNSINAEWLATEDIQADGGVDGVNVPIAIIYRTDEDDPYQVRA